MADAAPEARRVQPGGAELSAPLRVALLQLADLEGGERACREAAARGADVALFPELWNPGYRPFAPHEALAKDGAFVRGFAALARELELAIGITYLEAMPVGPPRNALTLFDRRGAEALHFAKFHLCPWDPPDTDCAPGDGFPVCTLDTRRGPVRTGAMICFDRELPESGRLLGLAGAELVLVPNACTLDEPPPLGRLRIEQLRARAWENLYAVAMANYAAPLQDGHSCAFLPDGGAIVEADARAQVVLADVDLERVRAYRKAEQGRYDARRPELYGALSAPAKVSAR